MQVAASWASGPALTEAALFDRRDLMPTGDVRAYMGWILNAMAQTNRADIRDVIFPGVDLGRDPGIIRA